MANGDRALPVRHAHESSHLTYGHFGTATYNTQSQEWTFSRQYVPQESSGASSTHSTPHFRTVRPLARIPIEDDPKLTNDQSTAALGSLSVLLRYLPEVAPAFSEIKTVTPSITLTEGQHTQTHDNNFAFGSVSVLEDGEERLSSGLVSVIACTSTRDTGKMILACLDSETISCEDDMGRMQSCQAPRISMDQSVCWNSRSGPVEQLSFSNVSPMRKGSFIAARSPYSTTVFYPLLRPASNMTATSLLDPNPILTIPFTATGDSPHADVAFDLDGQDRLAIIDVQGNLSIWEIRGRRSATTRILFRARLSISVSMHIQKQFLKLYQQKNPFFMWHKICWLSTSTDKSDTVAVCNRTTAQVYDSQGVLQGAIDTQRGSRTAESYILDVQASGVDSRQCFILTTSQLIWMSTRDTSGAGSVNDEPLNMVASWNHFKGHRDMTLQMCLLPLTNGQSNSLVEHHRSANNSAVTYVFLSTKTNSIVIVYRAIHTVNDLAIETLISDPTFFNLPVGHFLMDIQAIDTLQLESDDRVAQMPFFKMFMQDNQGEFSEAVCQLREHQSIIESQWLSTRVIQLPSKHIKSHKSTRLVSSAGLDDFILDDCESYLDEILLPDSRQADGLKDQEGQIGGDDKHQDTSHHSKTLDLHPTYINLVEQGMLPVPNTQNTFRTFLERLQSEVVLSETLALLSEMLSDRPYVSEIEDDSKLMTAWLSEVQQNDFSLREPDFPRISVLAHRSLLEIYEKLVQNWISTLPSNVPNRTRVFQERLSRHVALELFLSNIVIRPNHSLLNSNDKESSDSDMQEIDLPSQARDNDRIGRSSSQVAASTATDGKEGPRKSVLAQYTTFTKPVPPVHTSPLIDGILSHLPSSIDIDPSSYEYREVEKALILAESQEATQNLDHRARRKLEKAARVRERQLERQNQFKRTALEQTTSVPTVMSSQMPSRLLQSSQAAPTGSSQTQIDSNAMSGINMTQPERGAYGTREGRTSKKKKGKEKNNRRAGFL